MQTNHHSTLYYFQHAPVSRAIAHFGVPSMVTMLVAILYNLVDTAFVGMLGDVNALAAVSLAMPVLLVTNGVGQVFGIGCASYISRLLGRGEYRRVKQVSALALYGAAIAGAAVIALCFLFLGPILQILGTSANTLTPTRQYFTVLLAGGPASVLSFALSMVIRAAGDAKAAMKGNLIGTAVNIALDPLFIFTLGMGVRGAAVATVLGNACALAFYLRHIGAKSGFLSISPAHFRPDRAMLRAVFSIGLPSFLMKGVYVAGFLVQNNAAAAFGDVYVAALGLVFKITMMPKQLCMGLCMGVQPLVGYSSTAGQPARMGETVRKTLAWATLLGGLFALAAFAAAGPLLGLFTGSARLIAIGAPFLRIAALSFFAYGAMYTTTTLFQATGHAGPAFAVSLMQEAVLIPMVLLGTAALGVWGVAWAIPAGDATAMLIGLLLQLALRKRLYGAPPASPARQPA